MMRIGACGAARQPCSNVAIPWLSGSHRSSRIAVIPFRLSRSSASSSRCAHSTMKGPSWSSARASRTERPSEESSPIRRMRIAFAPIEGSQDGVSTRTPGLERGSVTASSGFLSRSEACTASRDFRSSSPSIRIGLAKLRCRPPSAGARERAFPRGRLIRLSPASPVLSTRPVYRPRASRRCPIEHTGKTSDFRCWIPRV